jgi:multidrug efflux system membrane fusion protein
VDTQAALVKQDAAQVLTDKAGVDSAKLNLTYTLITAPAAGRVGLRQVDVGNYIPVGSTTGLVVLTQVDPIDVVFTIPEDNVPQITKRQRAGATLPVTVFDRGGGTALAQGKLSTLDNQIDTSTGTVKAKARFDNGDRALFPNQFVNARLLVDVLCNAVVVPTTAVRHGSQGDFVYTLQPDRTAKMVTVKTGAGTPETVSILSGLTGSETVITEGDRPAGGGVSGGRRGGGGFSGGGRGRRGGAGPSDSVQDANAQIDSSDVQGLQNATIPAAQIPPGACPAAGAKGGMGGHGHGHAGGDTPPPGNSPAGQANDGPGQGARGGFRRRGPPAPGQG